MVDGIRPVLGVTVLPETWTAAYNSDRADMRRTGNRFRSLLILAVLSAVMFGCEIVPDREFAALEKELTVKIVEATRSASGGSIDFSFELANHGRTSAMACLGPSRSVSYKVTSLNGISDHTVDHPGCMREFTIQSGGVMLWTETLEVTRLPAGRVEVEVTVQIANPRRCGQSRACAVIDLKSNQFEIP